MLSVKGLVNLPRAGMCMVILFLVHVQTASMPSRFTSEPLTTVVLHGSPADDVSERFSQSLSRTLSSPVFATYTLPEKPGLVQFVVAQVKSHILRQEAQPTD